MIGPVARPLSRPFPGAAWRSIPALVVLGACSGGPAPPAALDTRNDTCSTCRMIVSDARLAAQIVAPGEEPRFFDEIGCLREYLAAAPAPRGAMAYVADHRTRIWVWASRAVYAKVPDLETPMGSHWIAFADTRSRDADPDARDGVVVSLAEIFGPQGPPDGQDASGRATPGARGTP